MIRYDQQGCAHAWAHGLSHEGRASALYFEGAVIYSYGKHFPIAYHDGDRIFFTVRSYSRTTAKHKCRVRSAVSHKKIISVPFPPTSQSELCSPIWLQKNLEYWTRIITTLQEKQKERPRRRIYAREAAEVLGSIGALLEALDLPADLFPQLDQILSSGQSLQASIEAAAIMVSLPDEEKVKRQFAMYQNEVNEWRGYLRAHAPQPGRFMNQNTASLRFNMRRNTVETTKGIHAPVTVAHRFWLFIRRKIEIGECSGAHRFMQFTVDEISATRIVVGCHTISMAEVDYIASQLGWK